ncbi:MAG: SprT-like domain-containing protein [Oscillospiraceae bacterium]|nr:SprT-like domain-containing protein [Oscillospiraceae bacterium]
MPYTLADVRREYDRLDGLCGVNTTQVALRVSTRAVRRLGSCRCVGDRVDAITISDFVLSAPETVFLDTIRHEYAHALVKLRFPRQRHGHDALWKAACREVGCSPLRCCDPAAIPALPRGREEPYRHRLRCLVCGAHWDYKRETKLLRLIRSGGSRHCTCPHCGGHRFAVEAL